MKAAVSIMVAGLCVLCGAGGARGALLFSDDFESYPVNSALWLPWQLDYLDGNSSGEEMFWVKGDTADFFGAGVTNQVLWMQAEGGVDNYSRVYVDDQFSDDVLTISFDLAEPADGLGPLTVYVGRSVPTSSTGKFAFVYFDNGTVTADGSADSGAYAIGTGCHVDILLNATTGTVSYLAGAQSLTGNTYDVWINGSRAIDNAPSQGTALTGDLIHLRFMAEENGSGYLDNVVVDSDLVVDVAIPEPASVVLAGLGSLILLRRGRRPACQ